MLHRSQHVLQHEEQEEATKHRQPWTQVLLWLLTRSYVTTSSCLSESRSGQTLESPIPREGLASFYSYIPIEGSYG